MSSGFDTINDIETIIGEKFCQYCGDALVITRYKTPSSKKGYVETEYCERCQREDLGRERSDRGISRDNKANLLISNACFPPLYKKYRLVDFPEDTNRKCEFKTMALTYIREFDSKSWLTLWGNVGTGKSCVATSVGMNVIWRKLIPAKFLTGSKLQHDFAHGIPSQQIKTSHIFNYYANLPLLILDDLGADQRVSVMGKIFDLLEYRYSRQKATVITTNLDLPQEGNEIKRIYERASQSPNKIFFLDWPSMRK